MTLVVNTSLNAVTDVNTELGLHVLVLGVDSGVSLEDISAEVLVATEVGELSGQVFGGEGGSLLFADVFGISTSELDPLGVGLDSRVETSRRVINLVR